MHIYDPDETARLLDYRALVDALNRASSELERGQIHMPVRLSLPLAANGQFVTMPASAQDIAIHKLVSVNSMNKEKNLPTIFGLVTVCNGETGEPEFILDGPTLTGRRTAALSMLGVQLLHPAVPEAFAIIGTGVQAMYHAEAIFALYPRARLWIKGRHDAAEIAFRDAMESRGIVISPAGGTIPEEVDTVIAVTTSKIPVYSDAVRAGRLVIGAGSATPDAAELSSTTIRGSMIFVDNMPGARAEAGDLLQANVDWTNVVTLGMLDGASIPTDKPRLMKSVGCGAWDLAACRVARDRR
jgi:1-piperideine-2-carboxylate/1-pyrroline-2-carboxylate reductase [NAD(P)H]